MKLSEALDRVGVGQLCMTVDLQIFLLMHLWKGAYIYIFGVVRFRLGFEN